MTKGSMATATTPAEEGPNGICFCERAMRIGLIGGRRGGMLGRSTVGGSSPLRLLEPTRIHLHRVASRPGPQFARGWTVPPRSN